MEGKIKDRYAVSYENEASGSYLVIELETVIN
jgi:hypothetical protein